MTDKSNDYKKAKEIIKQINESIENCEKETFKQFLDNAFANSTYFHGDTWTSDNEKELNNQLIKAYADGIKKFFVEVDKLEREIKEIEGKKLFEEGCNYMLDRACLRS